MQLIARRQIKNGGKLPTSLHQRKKWEALVGLNKLASLRVITDVLQLNKIPP
jgi:hypothetical protein